MRRGLVLAGMVSLLATPLAADPAETFTVDRAQRLATDPILGRLVQWTDIASDRLRLDESPPPHRVVLALVDGTSYSARASFGALLWESPKRERQGRAEVVVGNDKLDSSRFRDPRAPRWAARRSDPLQQLTVAVENADLALARDLWRATDASYKAAVQRWKAKVAARQAVGDDSFPPDWSPAEPVVSVVHEPLEPVPAAALREMATMASAALRKIGGLDEAEVTVRAVNIRYYTVTSEGTRLVQPGGYAAVHAMAERVLTDGVKISDERQWVARHADALPPLAEIVERVGDLGRNVAARAAAGTVDYYEGPVVFEGRAAAEFFRYLVPPEIEGTPPVPEAGRSYKRQTRSGPRLGRRLLPDGWSIVDDPARTPDGLAGGYAYDREGVAGQRVTLVEDGYVRDLLMNRVPRADKQRSNGHARGSIRGPWVARPAVWRVRAPRNLDPRAFDRRVRESRERARVDRILVVRRMARERSGRLPAPALAVWRAADGREEPVKLLEFEHVDRRTLRSIVAAGGEVVLSYLAPWNPADWPQRDSGLPTVLTAPSRLLVEDMELVFPGPSDKPRAYPRP